MRAKLKSLGSNAPWQIFPGIFSSIDVFTKRVVHDYFDQETQAPAWLSKGAFEGARTYVNPPHHSKFRILCDGVPPVLLTGEADGIFKLADDTHLVADYKTARYNKGRDEMLPVYEAQLNAYAHIAEDYFGPDFRVSKLALVYMEPPESKAAVKDDAVTRRGFKMDFCATVVEVERNPDAVPRLIEESRRIHGLATMPPGASGCKDCVRVDDLRGLFA